MEIKRITDDAEKQRVAAEILNALPEWFSFAEARNEYISESVGKIFFCSYDSGKPIGFLYMKETGESTAELAVMGVLKEYHRSGIGRTLFEKAKQAAIESGYSFIQVKTVKQGMYDCYDNTNMFYRALGFKEFEVMPSLWGEDNPCQIYVMSV